MFSLRCHAGSLRLGSLGQSGHGLTFSETDAAGKSVSWRPLFKQVGHSEAIAHFKPPLSPSASDPGPELMLLEVPEIDLPSKLQALETALARLQVHDSKRTDTGGSGPENPDVATLSRGGTSKM